jgi:hypothetical protein
MSEMDLMKTCSGNSCQITLTNSSDKHMKMLKNAARALGTTTEKLLNDDRTALTKEGKEILIDYVKEHGNKKALTDNAAINGLIDYVMDNDVVDALMETAAKVKTAEVKDKLK